MNIQAAQSRSKLYSNIRNFFLSRGYLEVETPTLSEDLIPEPTIDNFSTTFINEFCGSKELYMVPSPEVHMKRLIADGSPSIFQISKCFRNCEQIGNVHNPEFSMLEYYTLGFDENDSITLTEELLRQTALENAPVSVTAPWIKTSVRDAVLKYTGLDLDKLQSTSDLRKAAEGLGMFFSGPESWEDTFNRIFCNFVETSIPCDRPVLFTDYPKQIDCLAQEKGNYRRRWELYINGIEVANCYLEETDSEKVNSYYRKEYQRLVQERSANGRVIPDIDDNYFKIFRNFPKCSGVAIGLDRLLMANMGTKDIKDVLLFPFS